MLYSPVYLRVVGPRASERAAKCGQHSEAGECPGETNPGSLRVSTTRSELQKERKKLKKNQAGDDSRDAAGGEGVWKERKIRGRVEGGGRQTDPDGDIYRTLMKTISKMSEAGGNGCAKE